MPHAVRNATESNKHHTTNGPNGWTPCSLFVLPCSDERTCARGADIRQVLGLTRAFIICAYVNACLCEHVLTRLPPAVRHRGANGGCTLVRTMPAELDRKGSVNRPGPPVPQLGINATSREPKRRPPPLLTSKTLDKTAGQRALDALLFTTHVLAVL